MSMTVQTKSDGPQTSDKMAAVCLLALMAGVMSEVYGVPAEENTGAVFVSQQAANTVLLRHRRYNSGNLEEILHKDNLERECKEEMCSMEEAREVFENDEKTMEFWAGYIDGDQCIPPPCQNEGVCKDGINSYVCFCKADFSGRNCEIEVSKQCAVNNGGCSHFCTMQGDRSVCHCAPSYQLRSDKMTCEPTEQFSCGRVNLSSSATTTSKMQRRSLPQTSESNATISGTLLDDNSDNMTQIYDYYDYLTLNESHPVNVPGLDIRSAKTFPGTSEEVNGSASDAPKKMEVMSWAFPTIPSITEKVNLDERIVGGDQVILGEIPWQVALMTHPSSVQRAEPFCGGSLLNELWVLTAAHCLIEEKINKNGFFVRVGENDVTKDEGSERDYMVVEQHMHVMYNYKKSPFNHDIALLKLSNPVELSNKRRPICLGPRDFIENLLRESNNSLVSGWGKLRFQGPQSPQLMKLEVPYVDRTQCKQSSRHHVTRFMFCAGFNSIAKDSCSGDSGGPHATKYKDTWFLTGIVSWGEKCAQDGKYGVYTRVSRYYSWISQKTGIQIN